MRFDLPTMEDIRGVGAQCAAGVPMMLPVGDIDEDPEQPRKEFDEESLAQLAATIAGRGLRQPVSVRKHPERPGRWMLNFGARRLRAAKLVGEATIAAFEDAAADSYDQVIENEQREGLKPLEIALFIKGQLERGQSRADIARGIGKSKAYVTYACSLIDAPDWLMELYRTGRCRGMFELHELRRLHETNARVVEALLAEAELVGRVEVKLLYARVAEALEGKPPEDESRVGDVTEADNSVPGTPAASASLFRPIGANPSSRPAKPSAPGIVQPLNAGGDVVPLRPAVPRRLVARARYDAATVRVVLDELPEVPDSVFVIAEEGARSVVSVKALAQLELAFDTLPQP